MSRSRRSWTPVWFPARQEVVEHLAFLPHWSDDFEVPDVVGYRDYAQHPEAALAAFGTAPAAEPEPLTFFPYPKGSGAFREMCLATPRELTFLRAAAGHIAKTTEKILRPRRKHVYSSRYVRLPPIWTFRKSWTDFTMAAARRADQWGCEVMVRTDVRSYYPSIPIERLAKQLADADCLYGPMSFFIERVLRWQDSCGLRGLPVGPEACGIPGTVYLAPLDEVLAEFSLAHYRYTDDTIYFSAGGTLLREVDEALESLGLERSIDKTEEHYDPRSAREAIRKGLLDYLGRAVNIRPRVGLRRTAEAFEAEVVAAEKPDVRTKRWTLRTLGNHRDPAAVETLLRNRSVANLDPRATAAYLGDVATIRPELLDGAVAHIEEVGRLDLMAALRLHLLRLVSLHDAGEAAGRVCGAVAEDSLERPEVRAWAWQAAVANGYPITRALEAAMDEPDGLVSRGAVVTLRDRYLRGRGWLAREYGRRRPQYRPAGEYAAA